MERLLMIEPIPEFGPKIETQPYLTLIQIKSCHIFIYFFINCSYTLTMQRQQPQQTFSSISKGVWLNAAPGGTPTLSYSQLHILTAHNAAQPCPL